MNYLIFNASLLSDYLTIDGFSYILTDEYLNIIKKEQFYVRPKDYNEAFLNSESIKIINDSNHINAKDIIYYYNLVIEELLTNDDYTIITSETENLFSSLYFSHINVKNFCATSITSFVTLSNSNDDIVIGKERYVEMVKTMVDKDLVEDLDYDTICSDPFITLNILTHFMAAPDVTFETLTELCEGLKENYHGFCVYLKRDLDKYNKDNDLKNLYKSMFKECKDNKGKLISLSPLLKEIKEPLKEVKKVIKKHKYKLIDEIKDSEIFVVYNKTKEENYLRRLGKSIKVK